MSFKDFSTSHTAKPPQGSKPATGAVPDDKAKAGTRGTPGQAPSAEGETKKD